MYAWVGSSPHPSLKKVLKNRYMVEMHVQRKKRKNPLDFYLLKVTKFHDDSVKNESARTKKLQGGGRQTPPPPCLFRVYLNLITHLSSIL